MQVFINSTETLLMFTRLLASIHFRCKTLHFVSEKYADERLRTKQKQQKPETPGKQCYDESEKLK